MTTSGGEVEAAAAAAVVEATCGFLGAARSGKAYDLAFAPVPGSAVVRLGSRGQPVAAECVFSFEVKREHGNMSNALFGGLVGSLADLTTSCLVAVLELVRERKISASVSTAINLEFVAGAKVGDVLFIKTTVDKFGSAMAFTGADFYLSDPRDGTEAKLCYTSRHQKLFVKHLPNITKEVLAGSPKHSARWEAIEKALAMLPPSPKL